MPHVEYVLKHTHPYHPIYRPVFSSRFGVIQICPAFFKGKISGQAARLLREATRYLMIHEDKAKKIVDHTSGRYGCLRLAYEYPDKAVHNAESYRCFALNLNVEPKKYKCL